MKLNFYQLPTSVGDVSLKVAKGHFATRNSHTNYFFDVTAQRCSLKGANAVAQQLAAKFRLAAIDTILCMDGTVAIGTCLAQQLARDGYRSMNAGEDIYILRENKQANGMLIFRENAHYALKDKNVLILTAAITTGLAAQQGMRCVRYYGGTVAGIASIYSYVEQLDGIPVESLFNASHISDYISHSPETCPLCAKGIELDAVVDKYGYSSL